MTFAGAPSATRPRIALSMDGEVCAVHAPTNWWRVPAIRSNTTLRVLLFSCAFSVVACGGGESPDKSGAEYPQIETDATPRTLSDSVVSCPACELTLTPVSRFGSAKDRSLLQRIPIVAVDSRWNVYAVEADRWGHLIQKYDSAGRQQETVGGVGVGPGEYRLASGLYVGPGDTLVVSREASRLEVFDPSGRPVRSIVTNVGVTALTFVDGGLYLLAGRGYTKSSAGLPLHLMTPTGELLRSFGTQSYAQPLLANLRRLAPAGHNRAWVVEWSNPRIELMDMNGVAHANVGLSTPGFRPRMKPPDSEASTPSRKGAGKAVDITHLLMERRPRLILPPTPSVRGIAVDSGLIWLVSRVASANWQTIEVTYDPLSRDEPIQSDNILPAKYDSQVEVIDPVARTVVFSKRLPGLWEMPRAGALVRLYYDSTGVVTGDVYKVSLRRNFTQPLQEESP